MKNPYEATAEMAIRKPIEDVFQSFIDPSITSKFWFSAGSALVEEGSRIEWHWSWYNLVVPVQVLRVVNNESILVEWGEGKDLSKAEWTFQAINSNRTFIRIRNFDFLGEGDQLVNQVTDSTGGFTMVLAGCKAYLEHGIQLNLVEDKFPKELW